MPSSGLSPAVPSSHVRVCVEYTLLAKLQAEGLWWCNSASKSRLQ